MSGRLIKRTLRGRRVARARADALALSQLRRDGARMPDLSALVACYRQDQRVGARQINHVRAFGTDRYVSAHRFLEPNDRKNELLSLELTWALRGMALTSATGYSRFSARGPARPD